LADRKRNRGRRRARKSDAAAGPPPEADAEQPDDVVEQPDVAAADAAGADEAHEPGANIVRGDLPGSLDHASGADDEFDAALIAGAGGETVSEGELEDAVRESEQSSVTARRPAPPVEEHHGNRAIGFLKACWAELQRVQWPDRRHVGQATAVVIGFVALAGAYLGLADVVAKEIVERIL